MKGAWTGKAVPSAGQALCNTPLLTDLVQKTKQKQKINKIKTSL